MKTRFVVASWLVAASVLAADWSPKVAAFSATCNGAPVAGETLKSGDKVSVTLTPPDVPESLGISFSVVERDKYGRVKGRGEAFEFDGMPIHFAKDRDANVWRAEFTVPPAEKARTVAKGNLMIGVLRYGADTHFDGRESFAVPFSFDLAEGVTAPAPTSLRIYDFGPDGSAVYRGAAAVSRTVTPKELKWISKPSHWEKAVFSNLDALMHDWAARNGGGAPIAFRLALPTGKWRVAAGFGGFGRDCWANSAYQPAMFEFSANDKVVCSRAGGEKERFAFREHEAEPDEDLYETYVRPIVPETRFDVDSDGAGVEFRMTCATPQKKMAIDYLAVWPADDRAAEAQFDSVLERRKMRFYEIANEKPATDRCGQMKKEVYVKERERVVSSGPLFAALANPYDWVLPTMRPPETAPSMTVKAARGEKCCGALMFRGDSDEASVLAVVKGFPAWANAKAYRLMNYRFVGGYSYLHYVAPNHLMPGPRAVKKGVNYSWLVRFEIPEDAPAGTYRGEVELTGGAERRTLPAELVVYDATLPKLDDYRIGLMGQGDGEEWQMRFAKKELGATTVHLRGGRLNGAKFERDANGRIVRCLSVGWNTPEEMDRRFKTYAKVGFPCKVPYCGPSIVDMHGAFPIEGMKPFTPGWNEAAECVLKTVLAIARSNGCESVALDVGGEIGHDAHRPDPQAVEDAVRFLKFAKSVVPGIEYTWRCNCIDSTTNFWPLLDYACVRGNSWKWADAEGDFGKRKLVGVYSQGGRFMNGVSGWYHGAKGSFREWVVWGHGLEFNEFLCQGACGCAGHVEGMFGPESEGGYTLTQRGEAWRAGIDDIRYLKFLENAIAASPDCATKDEARKFLGFVRDSVRNAWAFCRFCALSGPGWQMGCNDWPYLRIDLMRDVCIRFAAALKNGEPVDLPPFPSLPEVDEKTWLALDDGPLALAGSVGVDGAVRVPKGIRADEVSLTLSGEGVTRQISLVPQAFRQRKLYYIPGTVPLTFTVPAADLKPGNYALMFSHGSTPLSVARFVLAP